MLRTNSRIIDSSYPKKVKVTIKASTESGNSVSKNLWIDFTNVFNNGDGCFSCYQGDYEPLLEKYGALTYEKYSIKD
jgi:hypothetical protein